MCLCCAPLASQVAESLSHLVGEASRETLQAAWGLDDRKPFREHYLRLALDARLIALTRPDKPGGRLLCYYLAEMRDHARR
jgi:hypothetical protein